MNHLIDYFARRGTLVNVITIFVLILGGVSALRISREVFPNIGFDLITIQTLYPGSSAKSVEKLITNPLEQDLLEVEGISKISSTSIESQSVIVLKLDPDQTTVDEAKIDIQDVIDNFRELPDGAEDPLIAVQEFKNYPIIQVGISGDLSEDEIRKTSKLLEKQIKVIPEVSRVDFRGLRDYEIRVEARPKDLAKYKVSLSELSRSLRINNKNIPGGVLESNDQRSAEMMIRTIGEFENSDDVKNTIIRANAVGKIIKVSDVADISQSLEKAKTIYRANGKDSIILSVLRKEGADAINLVNNLKKKIESIKNRIPSEINISYINDYSYFVKRRLNVLSNNLFVGLSLVLLFLSLILPFRIALITAIGIPFAFFGAVAFFHLGDISLSLLSMMGLIIVIGMLVDDAIVVCEHAQSQIEKGLPPLQAAIEGTKNIWAPVLTSVCTTIIAFSPILAMPGIFGKFVYFIPLGVIMALIISLWECFFILPHHVAAWVKVSKHKDGSKRLGIIGNFWNNWISPSYIYSLRYFIKFRYLMFALAIALVGFSVIFAKRHIDFILFPAGTSDSFKIKVEAPVGLALEKTKDLFLPFEKEVAKLPEDELLNFTTTVGRQGGNNLARVKSGSQYGEIQVFLTARTQRERSTQEIIDNLKEKISIPKEVLNVTFAKRRGGPPVGKAVDIGVRGQNYQDILSAVKSLKIELAKIDGIMEIEDSYRVGKDELHLIIDKKAAATAGLSLEEIGTAVRSSFQGIVATSIRKLEEEIDVRVSFSESFKNQKKFLDLIEIPNSRGQLIKISSISSWQKSTGISSYEHEDNQRQVAVIAEVDTQITSSQKANNKLREKLGKLQQKHPEVSFIFGGEDRDTKESLASLIQPFGLAFLGIILILILLFQNIYQPLLVAFTIPLGIVAVIWAFYFNKSPFTFLAGIGMIALSGVIVNNAIVFLDFVNKARRKGADRFESILTAAAQRIRPIFLTTITTAVGILPTAYGIGGLDPFVVPIALALGWGIFGGSFLTLMFFPPTIVILDDLIWLLNTFKNWFTKGSNTQLNPRNLA